MTDLWYAIAHHVLVFGLVAMLASESALIRPGMSSGDIARAGRLDAIYGALASLVILAGVLRVIYGAKGPGFYLDNHWFWAKMLSFAALGILSIPPTLRLIRWRTALRTNPVFTPPDTEIATVRRYMRFELMLVVPIVVFAATMARYAR